MLRIALKLKYDLFSLNFKFILSFSLVAIKNIYVVL